MGAVKVPPVSAHALPNQKMVDAVTNHLIVRVVCVWMLFVSGAMAICVPKMLTATAAAAMARGTTGNAAPSLQLEWHAMNRRTVKATCATVVYAGEILAILAAVTALVRVAVVTIASATRK